ncbi:hypothetical protein RJT34_21527 [Clitoria ternatea]|uniref:SANT domain-containing protein n=1 Tax=Clitoria ternatea TaxID=43366 RepID=A0AAN9IUB9_CLITE
MAFSHQILNLQIYFQDFRASFTFLKLVSWQDNFTNCFKNGNFGEKRSTEDFILNELSENSGKHGPVWTVGETLLLLESVLKHGDDWELVAQSVQTKTKFDCISKLIELPFGELMLGPLTDMTEDQSPELANENEQNDDVVMENPSKRKHVFALSDSSSSLMKQLQQLMLQFQHFFDENLCPREIFDFEEDYASHANSE